MTVLAEPLAIAARVGRGFDALEIPWLLGGSVASSLHGLPRFTQDVDLVADLRLVHVLPLVADLEVEFYIDADSVRDAIRRRASFNLIHLATMTKVDVFLLKGDALSRGEMARRVRLTFAEGVEISIATAEDIILQKLDWYRKGEFVSERQWRDVLGVIKVRGAALDLSWLRETSAEVGLEGLLEEALQAADRPGAP